MALLLLTFYFSHPLLLHRLRHLISHCIIQTLRLQITQRIARRFEVIGELLRESLVKGGVFHVDDHGACLFAVRSFLQI